MLNIFNVDIFFDNILIEPHEIIYGSLDIFDNLRGFLFSHTKMNNLYNISHNHAIKYYNELSILH